MPHFGFLAERLKPVGRLLAIAILGGLATCLFGTPTAAAAASPALFNRTTLNYSSSLSASAEADRYNVMVLQSTNASEVKALHAANPGLKILMAVDALHSSSSDPSALSTCTSYASDNAQDPSWFLDNQSGSRIVTNSEYMMDMGNAAYQAACVSHAAAMAKADGFSGVIFGGLNASSSWLVPSGTSVAKYATTASWDAAMQSFLNYAGKTVQADGETVMADLGGTSLSLWEQWTAPLNGSEQQAWTDGGLGIAQQIPYWTEKLQEDAWSEANQKLTILNSYNRTEAGNVYGLASMLLVANGYSSYATNNDDDASYEVWYPEYSTAEELGAPTGAYTRLSNGVYERQFTGGMVLVNPTATTVLSFSLGGSYINGSAATSTASLGPTTGLVLLSGPSPALFNRDTYDYSSSLNTSQEAGRYQVMVLQSTNALEVAALHAANPNLKILMYSMALFSEQSDPNGLSTCTPYSSDNANDPGWFMKNQSSNRVVETNSDTTDASMMDMGNASYEQACVAHAIALAKQDGFNGIMFDGVNSTWTSFVPSGTTVPAYPTNADWQAAMQKFLNYAGPTVQTSGLLAAANLGGTTESLWQQWTKPLNGSAEQGFTDGGEGLAQQVPFWSTKLANAAWSEANGKYAILNSYNTTEAGNTYGLASMLLIAGGYSSYSTNNSQDTSYEAWYPQYTDAQELGSALGPYVKLSNGVCEREFENGVVVVNPTTSSVPAFSLGGTYTGVGVSSTSSVSLGATSGLILMKSSS